MIRLKKVFPGLLIGAVASLLLNSCAGMNGSYVEEYNYRAIRTIAVAKLDSPQNHEAAGGAARDMITQYFIECGLSVVDSAVFDKMLVNAGVRSDGMFAQIGNLAGADAILDGSIFNYTAEKEERVYYTSEDGKISYETAFYNAKVAMTLRLIDVKTGEVVWVNSDDYESFDIRHTLEGSVYTTLRPLRRLLINR